MTRRVRNLPKDGVVRKPGAYWIPIDHYHTQAVCPGPSLSSGDLRTIYHKSPADFWAFSEMNPDRFERPQSDALTFGRAAHALLLEDGTFDRDFIVLTDDAPPRPTKAQVRVWETRGEMSDSAEMRFRFWNDFDARAYGRTILKVEWMEDIRLMSEALGEHPLVGPLFDGLSEVSLVWQDEATGIWLKARPDMLPKMGDVKADLKTCADASLRPVMRDIASRGYDMQAAHGCTGIEAIFGEKITSDVMVFVQKTPPYHVTPVEITEDALHWAKKMNRKALDTAARCLETGIWPGPVEGIPQYSTPEWRVHELGQAEAAAKAESPAPVDFV